MDYQLLLFAHILGLVLFVAGHGVSMFFAVALRRERDPARLRALADLSLASLVPNYIGLLLLIVSGIWMGVQGQFWTQGWIWTAIAILLIELAVMIYIGQTFFGPLRTAIGLQPARRSDQVTLGPVAAPDELANLLASRKPAITMAVGVLGLLVLLWLMVFKPF